MLNNAIESCGEPWSLTQWTDLAHKREALLKVLVIKITLIKTPAEKKKNTSSQNFSIYVYKNIST